MDADAAFRTFTKANWRGLPQSSVVAMAQSSDGVLWIGTLDGVATVDGKSITPVAGVAPRVTADAGEARVLLADDWVCREIAAEALRVHGVGVTAAASGRAAWTTTSASRCSRRCWRAWSRAGCAGSAAQDAPRGRAGRPHPSRHTSLVR